MKIAVIGCGFVGGTVADFLEEHTVKDGVEVIRCDPFKYEGGIEYQDLRELDGAIFCLNAATMDSKEVDLVPTIKAITEVLKHNPDVEIMVKSTIPMFTKLTKSPADGHGWNERIVYNPEFLRETTAKEDFANQQYFILGVAKHLITYDIPAEDNVHAKFWTNLFAPSLPNTEFIYTDRETAVMVKYTHNAWLATKVAFFHELSTQMPGLSDYNEMVNILSKFENIGPSHMSIPNADGGLGYGGGCFPKDMKAISFLLQHAIVDRVVDLNEDLKLRTGENLGITQRVTMDEYKKEIPDEPYILFIGTSHTYGECDGTKIDSYTTYVQDALDIKVVTIGYSGATNMELLQITNELNDIGMFGDQCKLVILEPRITENSYSVSLDELIGYNRLCQWLEIVEDPTEWNYKHASNPDDRETQMLHGEKWRGRPQLNRTSMNSRIAVGQPCSFGRTLNEMISKNINFNRAMDNRIFEADILNHFTNGEERLNNSDFMKYILSEMPNNTRNVQEGAKYELGYKNGSVLAMHNDLTCIEAIRNTIKNAGVSFRWMLVDNRITELHHLQYATNGITDIFKDMLFTTPLQALVTGNRRSGHNEIPKDIICGCGHFNEKGNKKIAEEFITPAVKNVLTKLKEL